MNEPALIKNLIHEIRGYKVMLDSDLAMLYEVETKKLNQAVKRNIERFPDNFMFQLTEEEWQILRCQFGTSNKEEILRSQFVTSKETEEKRGGRQYLPMSLLNKVLQCSPVFSALKKQFK